MRELGRPSARAVRTKYSAFGALYTNDNKAELMIVVIVVICRLTQKYAQMQQSAIRHEFDRVASLVRAGVLRLR